MKSDKTTSLKTFDIADHLDNPEVIVEYLNNVLQKGDASDLISALSDVSRAIGMSKIAESTGMSRPSLYKALAPNARPQFNTILKVLRAIGGNLSIVPSKQ